MEERSPLDCVYCKSVKFLFFSYKIKLQPLVSPVLLDCLHTVCADCAPSCSEECNKRVNKDQTGIFNIFDLKTVVQSL